MNTEQVQEELKKINDYLSQCLWMDFDYKEIYVVHKDVKEIQIRLRGSIDLDWEGYEAIEIIFSEPYYISTYFDRYSNVEGKPFIQLGNAEEYFGIEDKPTAPGYLFYFNAEGYEKSPIYIYCESIRCNILKDIKDL